AVTISMSDSTSKGIPSDLSVTVYRKEGHAPTYQGYDIVDHAFLFGDVDRSDQQVPIPWADSTRLSAIDQYLITRKWSRFEWSDIWSGNYPIQPFSGFLQVAGRAFRANGELLPDSTLITFLLQRSVMTYVADVG